jgi:hypothetical protein
MTIKWLYLAPRSIDIAQADFAKRWLGHAKLASQFPDLLQYFDATIYCLVSPDLTHSFDAAGIITLADRKAVAAVLAHPLAATVIFPDEKKVFSDYVARFSIGAEPEVVGDFPARGYAMLAFIRRSPNLTAAQFAHTLRKSVFDHLTGEMEINGARCVLNWQFSGIFDSVHDYDAVVEYYPTGMNQWDEWRHWTQSSNLIDSKRSLFVQGPVIMNWVKSIGR